MSAPPFTRDVARVAAALNAGRVAIVPTDTVYGVAASLEHPAAITRIFAAKGRPDDKPIPILVDSPASAERYVSAISAAARRLMIAFWPGPLTIVMPAANAVPEDCLAGGSTVGLRLPDHSALRELLTACGGALAVTSANRSGCPETQSPEAAYAALRAHVDIVLDCGELPDSEPSTVVEPSGAQPRIIRSGAVDADTILRVVAGR